MANILSDNKKEMEAIIADTAGSLLRRHGIRAVTMDDIAAELAISKKTIYQYFNSKTALIDAVITIFITQKAETLNKTRYDAKNAIEEVFLSWYAVENFFLVMNQDELDQLKKFSTTAYKAAIEFKDIFLYRLFKTNMETGITQELYRENINPGVIAQYALEVISIPVNVNMMSKVRISYIDAEDQMLRYHLHAIATEKGIELVKKYQQELLAHKTYFK